MRPFVYEQLAGRVVFGEGTVAEIPNEIDLLAASRVLLVSDTMAKDDGDALQAALGDRVVARIAETRPHVPAEDAEDTRRLAEEHEVDGVVTIGGGSTTGLGKALVLDREVAFLAVPTTYAGSEMTPIYGITGGAVKRTGRHPRVKPRTVVYDVELTVDIPLDVTAGSVMNALAHCVEALYAKERNPIISVLALEGITALRRGAVAVSNVRRDRVGRSDLLYGAFLAGTALGATGVAVHHRICHVLGGTFGLAHGDANAVILPYAVAYNRDSEPEVMRAVAGVLDATDAAGGLYELARNLGAPGSLSTLGIDETQLDRAADMVTEAGGYNPRPVERGWVRSLLQEAFEGGPPSR